MAAYLHGHGSTFRGGGGVLPLSYPGPVAMYAIMYREDHKVVRLFANKKNFFNNRWNLNLRCPGETSDTYLTIDQKFIGVVITETKM
jgi:hypothetical protein